MACRWESCTETNLEETVENRWAASDAMIMEPPWPMQRTLRARRNRSAAARTEPGSSSRFVRSRASAWAVCSFSSMSSMLSSGATSPVSLGASALTAAVARAILNPPYPGKRSRRQKRVTVASATAQASASSEMDIYWHSSGWSTT